ncbi:xre family toxin-antitoxin system, antitoxin component [Streptomyces himastatinicus ATCC 53653]|uniref:Xre family toxin-antitoxin system, antitoxin component n=1 Tax=Streptomyces himastatinicus ATCC 53653 TaxID=457427 RepID=D9WII8_9ACTN|nr:helix-turn-helix transcriptional regulator [Streptomyces himastatinicus]EFL25546.1 xre family toxin-antitoxin system, antitoxin component [Streptomyces himastatinicus ATCC 53653]
MPPRNSPTARQQRLGAELRKMREAAGMTAREAAELLGANAIQISQIEAGKAGVSEERLRRMASQYACLDPVLLDALATMAAERTKGWWEEYRGTLAHGALDLAELEHHATGMRTLQAVYVPGLLQTEDYVRALMAYGLPEPPLEQLEAQVAFRVRRREVLEGAAAPRFEAVIHEAVLRTRVADRKVAREQLSFILAQSERPNVTVRVIPFDVDGFGGAGASMLYVGGPVPKLDTVQLDAWHGSLWMDAESQLARYRALLDRAALSSLAVEESRDFIHHLTQEL